jgi:hypothetical protein
MRSPWHRVVNKKLKKSLPRQVEVGGRRSMCTSLVHDDGERAGVQVVYQP